MLRVSRAVVRTGDLATLVDVSLEAAPSESWALVGASGCGKGTLVAAVAGAAELSGGEIVVAGRSVRREPAAARAACGYAPAALEAWPAVRAADFLDLFAAAAGIAPERLPEARLRALELAGLRGDERLDRIPEGAAKRLLIGRAVLHDPALVALDDPFRGLDPHERFLVERLLAAAVEAGATVIAAIDDGCVPTCFTHLALLDRGRIVARGRRDPALIAPGRSWWWRVTVPAGEGRAARECLADRVPEAHLVDADIVMCLIDPALTPPEALVAALVRAGIGVDSCHYHPPWTAQLVPPRNLPGSGHEASRGDEGSDLPR